MTTDKIMFDKFVAERCTSSMIASPRIEKDGECMYECFDDPNGNEVAFIAWQKTEPTYIIREAE